MIQIDDDVIRLIIKEGNVVLVGSVDKDGNPNISPRFVLGIPGNEKLLFADVFINKTSVNVKAWPKATIAILDKNTLGGFQLKGDVDEVNDPALISQATAKLKEFGLNATPRRVWTLTVMEVYSLKPNEKSKVPLYSAYG